MVGLELGQERSHVLKRGHEFSYQNLNHEIKILALMAKTNKSKGTTMK